MEAKANEVTCPHCGERVLPGEADPELIYMQGFHYECSARGVIGSVGHLLGKCSCYGGTEEDPPNVSRREAARMALALVRRGVLAPPKPPKV